MAHAINNNQRSVYAIPPHQFIDLRAVKPPIGFFNSPAGVINPNFEHPQGKVFIPVNLTPPPPPPVSTAPQGKAFVQVNLPPPLPVGIPVRYILNPAVLIRMDEERSRSLLEFMANEGLVPPSEEEQKREHVIEKLKEIVRAWVKKVAWQRRLPKEQIAAACATVLTYGSYGLGVHGPESDIDALCVGPFFTTMAEDFFIVLRNMLKSIPEVSEIHCVKDAKVPLMRFKFDGISVDLPFAQLKVLHIHENVNLLDPMLLRGIDETSWKSLSGVLVNSCIIQLVPNLENFQSMLRCVKLWAKRRGVYGTLHGFFGGVHLAILAAHICQRNPDASLNLLIASFFKTFAYWPWPTPVMLEDGRFPMTGDCSDTRSLMPIRLPFSPYEYCHSNITRSTFYKIRAEFLRGHAMTKDLIRPDFQWNSLFEPFPYPRKYPRFVKIFLSASDNEELGDWVGWVKSRFRALLLKLEEVQGLCDPNPTEYADPEVEEPNMVFYWGLQPGRAFIDIEPVEKDFMKNISNGYQGPFGRIELSIVHASELPKNAQFEAGSGTETKACWKILDYNQRRIPVYSQHLPNYLVGYVATDGGAEYPSAVG